MAETLRTTGTRYCLEMHPGDIVYTPEKLLRLRNAVGPELGCNFDPSHLSGSRSIRRRLCASSVTPSITCI
jgi:sugar phosphate isomerase/epimerase